jgi:hypothetical protein
MRRFAFLLAAALFSTGAAAGQTPAGPACYERIAVGKIRGAAEAEMLIEIDRVLVGAPLPDRIWVKIPLRDRPSLRKPLLLYLAHVEGAIYQAVDFDIGVKRDRMGYYQLPKNRAAPPACPARAPS